MLRNILYCAKMFEEAADTLGVELDKDSNRFRMLLQQFSNCEVINA